VRTVRNIQIQSVPHRRHTDTLCGENEGCQLHLQGCSRSVSTAANVSHMIQKLCRHRTKRIVACGACGAHGGRKCFSLAGRYLRRQMLRQSEWYEQQRRTSGREAAQSDTQLLATRVFITWKKLHYLRIAQRFQFVTPVSTSRHSKYPHTVYLCVPYSSHNKQRLLRQSCLTGWFVTEAVCFQCGAH
jgi:hypothetical protein